MRRESARSVARDVIVRVTDHGGYSNLAIPGALRRSQLSTRDRAFAAELAYGTIRRIIPLDHAIDRYASRPVRRMSRSARAALRLGAYQLLFTATAAHAAVSETVDLAAPTERGFVNAILRKLSQSPPEPPPEGDDDRSISIRTGLAAWAVGELRHVVGQNAEAAARALAERATLTVHANPCRSSVSECRSALVGAGHEVRSGAVDPGSLLVENAGDPSALPGFSEGWFTIQDQASAFVVSILDAQPGDWVLDACAGPGGKTASLACAVQPGGMVVAADVHPRRASLVAKTARRLGVEPLVLAQDARAPSVERSFDRVLVDAPCTGIGSARRRPELLWRAERRQLSQLARLQVSITSAAAESLEPGGLLVYSVCTFPRAETDAACDAILRRRPDLEPEPTDGPDGRVERHRLWPHLHGCDAMFAAAFRKRAGTHR